jgi:hypothetical protein
MEGSEMMGTSLGIVIGTILLIAVLFFAAQGAGVIPWPRESFMVNETRWIYYGGWAIYCR